MDVTPLIAKGKQIITGYGNGGFKINHEQLTGSILIFPDQTLPWHVGGIGQLTADQFRPVLEASPPIEILLIGTGQHMQPVSGAILNALKAKGIATEIMDTGAACRTFNILLSEERRAGAALIAV